MGEVFNSRANKYNNLRWAADRDYLKEVVQAARPHKGDIVLDVGTGTGRVAQAIFPYVTKVIGLDISPEMLKANPCESILADARDMVSDHGKLSDNQFDKVVARMVFHHITTGIEDAAKECYRVLRRGGLFVLSEGVPPHPDLTDWYANMFAIKEKRLTFLPHNLCNIVWEVGLELVDLRYHIVPQVSIRNWIENSDMTNEQKGIMWETQRAMPEFGWKAYNARVTEDGDILKDFHFCTVVGEKERKHA